MPNYTGAVNRKFHPDGRLRYFPGNTVICKCPMSQPYFAELVWAQEQFTKLSFADKYAFLPPTSFHMTVFELLCDQVRDEAHWSRIIPQDMPIAQVDEALRPLVDAVPRPDKLVMHFSRCWVAGILGLMLNPADDSVAMTLRDYRNRLADATGIRFPNHDSYQFHITLAYKLVHLSEQEEIELAQMSEMINARLAQKMPVIELGRPEFVIFHNMGDFQPNILRSEYVLPS